MKSSSTLADRYFDAMGGWLVGLACLTVVALATSLRAESPAILVDRDLQSTRVRLLAITDGRVFYTVAGDNVLRDASADAFGRVLFVPPPATQEADDAKPRRRTNLFKALGLAGDKAKQQKPSKDAPPAPVWLELTDGQRFLGQPITASDEEHVRWRVPDIGEVQASIDHVRSVAYSGASPGFDSKAADRLILANGDRLDGFVVALRHDGVEFQPDGQTQSITLPRDRVRAVRLSNPGTPASDRAGHLIWLRDGQRVRAMQFDVDEDQVVFTPLFGAASTVARIPLDQVSRIDIASTRGRVIDLVDVPRKVTAGGEVFGVTMRPRVIHDARPAALASSALWLHAPVAVAFDLPEGADRLAFEATLGDARGTPTGWADAQLVVTVAGKEAARKRLTVKSPTASVNIPAGGRVEVRIESGVNGPVLDRVTLRDAVVHVATR